MKKEARQQPVFDFDRWAKLADTDPDAFEAQRRAAIEQAIEQAPERTRTRLRRLQWKLDQIRRTSGTPLAAAIRMNEMMWDRIAGKGGLLETLTQPLPARRAEAQAANVLDFRRD
ncbi:MAG TPA: DUF3135 domain-containing protein [Thiotrichales bacterium]|nr:DUF3135 domain-containing protein [Thiotrichales bacterium]